MKKIKLTQGKFTLVDNEDYLSLVTHKWYVTSAGYACRDIWLKEIGRRKILIHREILEKYGHHLNDLEVDHINHNILDNRKLNLRLATKQQNHFNEVLSKNNNSGFKGVGWHSQRGKWRARLMLDGKDISLGLYQNKKDAFMARLLAEKQYFGEFAGGNL